MRIGFVLCVINVVGSRCRRTGPGLKWNLFDCRPLFHFDPAPSPAASGAIAFALAKTSFASGQHASRLAIAERTFEHRNASAAVGIALKSVQAVVTGACRRKTWAACGFRQ
jgi:hypothetical protein